MRALTKVCRKAQIFFDHLIEEVPLRLYLRTYFLVVFLVAVIYDLLTPYGNGLGRDLRALPGVTLWDALYFSVVTVSSLGYGDMHPIGFSRLVASIEVLFGLAFMGIVIAKVTSRRLSYHVQRLFSSDAQKRLEEFSTRLGATEQTLKEAMAPLGRIYQATPEARPPSEDSDKVRRNFAAAIFELHATCRALASYVVLEVQQGKYFSIVPPESVQLVGDTLNNAFFNLRQLIISLPPVARTQILNVQVRKQISEAVESQKGLCDTVSRHSENDALRGCFLRVSETCSGLLERYFAMPGEVAAQPDQIQAGPDEPATGST